LSFNVKKIYNYLYQKIDSFLIQKESDLVSLDLGRAYVKGFYLKDDEIKSCFAEKSTGSSLAQAASWLKKNDLLSYPVTVSLKGPDTLVRFLPFPKVKEGSLKQVFGYEISKFIPFKKEDIFFDVFVLDRNYSQEEDLLLLAAAKKEVVSELMQGCAEKRINLKKITLSNLSLINLFLSCGDCSGNSALIDIGSGSTLLNIMKKDIPCLSREIKFGSGLLVENLARKRNVSREEAEQLIIDLGHDQDPEIKEEVNKIWQEVISDLSEEIKNSLDYFEVNWGQSVENIYLTGGICGIIDPEQALAEALGIKITVWDFWKEFKFRCSFDRSEYRQSLAAAAGALL